VAALKTGYAQADLTSADRAMLDFVAKLTRTPGRMVEQDLQPLRDHGFDDPAIHDIVQVTGLFAYYNRLADGLGIDLEP
jgi:4-carboxymuconolactone decarboxylase